MCARDREDRPRDEKERKRVRTLNTMRQKKSKFSDAKNLKSTKKELLQCLEAEIVSNFIQHSNQLQVTHQIGNVSM